MNTKFTPAPWVIGYDGASLPIITSKQGIVTLIRTGDEDAHLIAAAPDMYEALEYFVESYVSMINSGDCGFWNPEEESQVIQARAALAKARGE